MSKRRKRPDWKSVLGLREGPPSKAYAVLIFLLAFVVSGALALMRPDLPIVYVGLVVVAIILFALYTRNPVANKWARRFSSAVNSFLFFAIGFGLGRPDPNLDRLGDLFFMVVLWGAVTLRTTAVMDNNEQEERKQEEERAQQRHEDLLTSIKRAEQLAQKRHEDLLTSIKRAEQLAQKRHDNLVASVRVASVAPNALTLLLLTTKANELRRLTLRRAVRPR